MSVWKLVKLDFQTNPVHFGELGIGMEETAERIHSDTLYSAWFSAYARLYPQEIEALFDRFPIDKEQPIEPPFRLSSTFVYSQSALDADTYYLPTLLKLPTGYPHGDLKFAKAVRKLKFLPLSVWQRWYQGIGIEADREVDELLNKNGELAKVGTFNYGNIFKGQTLPKVAVDRIHNATNFYQTSFVYFENGGLYFLFYMPTPDDELYGKLKTALNWLGDEGIGGERSSGAGRFTADWLELTPEWKEVIQAKIDQLDRALISLFWDTPEVCYSYIEAENTRYQLQERGGWISARSGRQLRRKSVRMFTEGSVFSQPDRGRLAVVTPDELKGKNHHPIYRSGISLSLPVTPHLT
jgi:CRISPR-associated protein Csm4